MGAESLKFLFQNSIPIIHINIKDHEDINRLQLQGKFLAQAIESLLKQGSLKKLNVRNIARDIAAYIYPWNEKTAKMLVDQITYIERKSSPYGKLDQANHLIW
ncbi:hypothetical protein A2526_06735 [candidate division WOR-1 bacterium RIFOXYD2_FULL_36_8]|nr:MAG: hypothetical protein A2526_06735 [candidate division WOR-1 bacterium RIFOXYD2_FULL_36_8]